MSQRDQYEPAGADRPVRIFRYELGRSDALAYKLLRRELRSGEKFRLLVWIGLAGMSVGMLPDTWSPYLWWSVACAILVAAALLAVLWSNLVIRRQAARLQAPIGAVTLEEWHDRLLELSGARSRNVGYDAIAQVIETEGHVFLRAGDVPLIVPREAFRDRQDMAAFARRVDDASMRAQP